MSTNAKDIEAEYLFQRTCLANFLKADAMARVRQMCMEITSPFTPPYAASTFYQTIKKELTLSKFEAHIPPLTKFTDSEYATWKSRTDIYLSLPSTISNKVLDAFFHEFPMLKKGLLSDMQFSKLEFEKRQTRLYLTLGGVCATTLVGAVILARS